MKAPPSVERMSLQAGNRSVEEVPVGCGEQGNLSVEVTDYNVSCNSSVLPRPAARARGKTPHPDSASPLQSPEHQN